MRKELERSQGGDKCQQLHVGDWDGMIRVQSLSEKYRDGLKKPKSRGLGYTVQGHIPPRSFAQGNRRGQLFGRDDAEHSLSN